MMRIILCINKSWIDERIVFLNGNCIDEKNSLHTLHGDLKRRGVHSNGQVVVKYLTRSVKTIMVAI